MRSKQLHFSESRVFYLFFHFIICSSNNILVDAKYSSALEFTVTLFMFSIAMRAFSRDGGHLVSSNSFLCCKLGNTEKSLYAFLCEYLLFP